MTSLTPLHLPPTFPYPITITRILAPPSSNITHGSKLLEYSYSFLQPHTNSPSSSSTAAQPILLFGSWESPIAGTIENWNVHVGQRITLADAKAMHRSDAMGALVVKEPCRHDVQFSGLCAVCGEDMTQIDYTGFTPSSRASIPATHLAFGPTVSLNEAKRLAEEHQEWLLKERKLSLIVDLDQTVVHATVDPTVGEWIAEGQAWEKEQASDKDLQHITLNGNGNENGSEKDQERSQNQPHSTTRDRTNDTRSTTPPLDKPPEEPNSTTRRRRRRPNPNWEALKDVSSFKLAPEAVGLSPSSPRPKANAPFGAGGDGCTYYIKPRPGWQAFLKHLSKLYEMHIYTMGTRSYALSVLGVLDPDQSLFGNRVLSRDESGSLNVKSLKRLFPVDTSMVVVIDDRGDVWEWCENLVKVVPYDFFVGIGDINSAFLPKQAPLLPTPTSSSSASSSSHPLRPPSSVTSASIPAAPTHPTPEEEEEGEEESPNSEVTQSQMVKEQGKALSAQLEDRPLAKEQEKLNEVSEKENEERTKESRRSTPVDSMDSMDTSDKPDALGADSPSSLASPPFPEPQPKALLRNDDRELERVGKALNEVHRQYYEAYDASKHSDNNQKNAARLTYDVTRIIPQIRRKTFEGLHLLFSSVIPLDQDPERSEIWRLARAFGATCHSDLSKEVTHVVAAKPGTLKVDMARKKGGISIVWLSWFTDSIALWERQDENPYLLRSPSPSRSESGVGADNGHSPPSTSSTIPTLNVQGDSDDPGGVSLEVIDDFEDDADEDGDDGDGDDVDMGAEELKPIAEDTWKDANDEVDAAMMESDSELGDLDQDDILTDGDGESDRSVTSTPNSRKFLTPGSRGVKRSRSTTPSAGKLRPTLSQGDLSDPNLGSPLAKRKKIADRRGSSTLRQQLTAELPPESSNGNSDHDPNEREDEDEDVENEDAEESDYDESNKSSGEEDDFLAGELEEELG